MVRLRVLGLTTTAWRSFYRQQVEAVDRAGVEYTTLSVPGDHRAFEDAIRRRSMADYARFYPTVLRHSLREYDVLHANYGLLAPLAVAQPRLPVVLTLWGGEFIGNRYAPLIRFFAARADAVVVPSEPMIERLPEAVRDDAHLIPFPIDTDLFRPIPRAEARAQVGWETDRPVVLFPYAEARYEKNYPLAKRVVEGLSVDAELRSVANRPYEEMPYYVNASDALLITSRWESGPMVIKEALACNVPVVSRNVGFAPGLLDGVRHCHVGTTERELRSALESVLLASERSDGRPVVSGYGLEEMGSRLREVYEAVADDRSFRLPAVQW